jgi:uncharacterized protein YqhQ
VGAIGGQALVEGVMMRTGSAWAAAVRCDDGSITTTVHPLPPLDRWRKVPLARGVLALVESVKLGVGALIWATNERSSDPREQLSTRGAVLSVLVAAVGALLIFGVGPAAVAHLTTDSSSLAFSALEGALRLALLFGYLLLLRRSAEMRRTFAYHGAEHMTIHALEHGDPLEVSAIRKYDRRHPRCGTSFLVITVLVAVVAFTFLGRPPWPQLILSRIIGIPVVAGISYEVIRFAGKHRHSWIGRVLSVPGNAVQSITTQEPDDSQIEVAVAAIETVLGRRAGAPPAEVAGS